MKKLLAPIAVLFLFVLSCRKPDHASDGKLYGTWELRSTFGGNILPQHLPAGNGHLLSFSDVSYAFYEGGQVADSGRYHVEHVAGYDYLVSHDGYERLSVSQDTLYLYTANPDVARSQYIKVNSSPVRFTFQDGQ